MSGTRFGGGTSHALFAVPKQGGAMSEGFRRGKRQSKTKLPTACMLGVLLSRRIKPGYRAGYRGYMMIPSGLTYSVNSASNG